MAWIHDFAYLTIAPSSLPSLSFILPSLQRDDDHLALCQELLGRIPQSVALSGKRSRAFFTRKGELRNIRALRFWPLQEVLFEKYEMAREEAASLASFLVPMLDFVPERRATAQQALQHPWLLGQDVGGGGSQAAPQARPPSSGLPSSGSARGVKWKAAS